MTKASAPAAGGHHPSTRHRYQKTYQPVITHIFSAYIGKNMYSPIKKQKADGTKTGQIKESAYDGTLLNGW
jgi:hypothetical protein